MGAQPNESVLAALERRAAQARAGSEEGEGGELVAHTVELFDARRLHWSTGEGLYVLSAGNAGEVAIVEAPDGWQVWRAGRDVADVRWTHGGMALEYAQGAAEDIVRQLGAANLVMRDAAWRKAPASPDQLNWLRARSVYIRPGLSRGEASDLLSLDRVRRALEPATPKQLWALQRRGVAVPEGMTKRQAMRLLDGRPIDGAA